MGCPDSDGDGYSDSGDLFPDDSTQYGDLDLDGCGDNRHGPMEITSPQTPPNVLIQMGMDMETISVGKVRIISQVIQANGTILTEMDLETISMETTLTPVLKLGEFHLSGIRVFRF
ncbi:MAG: hypothetical protein Ct9H90mP16_10580 [Candidatus Poseidoniales archaeon]|nr:MAG: hypothetical protein Ct9H90mP16_10580 [Candidatus Poseidoniales archaeon]